MISKAKRILSDEEIDAAVAKVTDLGVVASNSYRAVRKMGLPMPSGHISQIATALRVSRFSIGEAVAILEIFNAHPQIRERREAELAAGRIGLRKTLRLIRPEAAELDRAAAAEHAKQKRKGK